MAFRVRQAGVARSRPLGQRADRNRHRHTVGAAYAVWRRQRAVRLIRRTPEMRNKHSRPICITYLVFQSCIFNPADPSPDPPGESSIRKPAASRRANIRQQQTKEQHGPET